MNRLLTVLLVGAVSATAFATEVYRVERPDGTIEFTDEPRLGAEKLRLREIQSYSAPPPPKVPVTGTPPGYKPQQESLTYNTLKIISPAYEETIFHDDRGLLVGVSVNPTLAKGHEIVIIIDGGEAARGTDSNFTIKDVYRGSHTLKAIIEDSRGRILKSSDPVVFFMRQRSVPRPAH